MYSLVYTGFEITAKLACKHYRIILTNCTSSLLGCQIPRTCSQLHSQPVLSPLMQLALVCEPSRPLAWQLVQGSGHSCLLVAASLLAWASAFNVRIVFSKIYLQRLGLEADFVQQSKSILVSYLYIVYRIISNCIIIYYDCSGIVLFLVYYLVHF